MLKLPQERFFNYMRDKKFVIDSIKMDLYRVVTASGDISKNMPKESVIEFMKHADKDFDKIELEEREKTLRKKLQNLLLNIDVTKDPQERLKWAEDVLTLRCLL